MTKTELPDYPPPDKCKRPETDFDFEGLYDEVRNELQPSETDEHLEKTLAQVSEANIIAWLKDLTEPAFETRHTLSPLNVEVATWLRNQFQTVGYADTKFHDFECEGLIRHNVVATKSGKTTPNSVVIVCAHYDSRMQNLADRVSKAPGADDNASGVTVLLELSRVLQSLEVECTIQFICFSGEEQGLIGSKAYAEYAHASGMDIRLLINLDMIGHPIDTANPTIIIESDTGNNTAVNDKLSQHFAGQIAKAAAAFTSIQTRFGPIFSSDYMPFEHLGFVCVGLYDGADGKPFYHTENDTPDMVDTGFCVEIVKMLAATVRQAAK